MYWVLKHTVVASKVVSVVETGQQLLYGIYMAKKRIPYPREREEMLQIADQNVPNLNPYISIDCCVEMFIKFT